MSKYAAVDAAVRTQIAAQNPQLQMPETALYQAVFNTTLGYTNSRMQGLLSGVSQVLAADTPAYNFKWGAADIPTCLSDTVLALIGYIFNQTN